MGGCGPAVGEVKGEQGEMHLYGGPPPMGERKTPREEGMCGQWMGGKEVGKGKREVRRRIDQYDHTAHPLGSVIVGNKGKREEKTKATNL